MGSSPLVSEPGSNPNLFRNVRNSANAAADTRGWPTRMGAHIAALSIHSGTTAQLSSGIRQIATRSPRRISRYCTATTVSCAGCQA